MDFSDMSFQGVNFHNLPLNFNSHVDFVSERQLNPLVRWYSRDFNLLWTFPSEVQKPFGYSEFELKNLHHKKTGSPVRIVTLAEYHFGSEEEEPERMETNEIDCRQFVSSRRPPEPEVIQAPEPEIEEIDDSFFDEFDGRGYKDYLEEEPNTKNMEPKLLKGPQVTKAHMSCGCRGYGVRPEYIVTEDAIMFGRTCLGCGVFQENA